MDKHIQGKREGYDYYNNSRERQDEWGSWQSLFCPPTVGVCVHRRIIVCFWEGAGEENARGAVRISGSWWYAKLCHWI